MLKKMIIVTVVLCVVLGLKVLGVDEYLSFDFVKENQLQFQMYYEQNRIQAIGIYVLAYILTTALSIPGATVLTLLGGALFGPGVGLLVVSFSSSIGATLAFLIARTVLRDFVQKKYGDRLDAINQGIEKDGVFYLFTLRLVPVIPFFLINLSMGLTKISTLKFFAVSQLGMLAGTAVYVNAGVRLSQLDSLAGIMSPALLGSFVLLGIFPLIGKKIVETIKSKKIYRGWQKPKSFDYNMVAIGAGAAGLVTSYIGATVKAKVALIEKESMGGDCLNTGCVPSKALIRAAKVAKTVKDSHHYGITASQVSVDFSRAMERVQDVIKKIEPHDSVERYTKLGVECISGTAEILSPWEIKVNDKVLTTKNITIATGASPFIPPIKGIEKIDYLSSNNLWNLRELPQRFVVLGAGPIGLEMAQSFGRFGAEVTVVEMGRRILPKEDADVSDEVSKKLKSEGVKILTEHKAVEFMTEDHKQFLLCENENDLVKIEFDKILIAVGRRPNITGFGLEKLKIEVRKNGSLMANEYLQTNYPNIYVAGDVTGPYQLTHVAAHQAWYCAVNALFGKLKKFKVDYSVVPWCTYLDPEVATVGKNELTCQREGIAYDVIKYGIDDLDRAIADSTDYGLVKVLLAKGQDKILGATIVGANAGELIIEFVTSMKHKKGMNAILGTIHSYPTMAEANKYAAGMWKQRNAPVKLLKWVEIFHKWSRS